MSRAGTRWGWAGRVRRKMTSRSSKQGAKESKVFFIVLIATIVPLLATLEPAVRTRATATLPKLPSPTSLMTSNLSSRVAIEVVAGTRDG